MVMAPNGNGNLNVLKLTLPSLGAIASILTFVSFITGAYIGYTAFKADMNELSHTTRSLDIRVASAQARTEQIQLEVLNVQKTMGDDRQALTNRLTGVERDIDFIKQGIAELKLRTGTLR